MMKMTTEMTFDVMKMEMTDEMTVMTEKMTVHFPGGIFERITKNNGHFENDRRKAPNDPK